MFDYPVFQASQLLNALLQSILLVVYPLLIALLFGGCLSFLLFFRNFPARNEEKPKRLGTKGIVIFACGYAAAFPILYLSARRFFEFGNGTALVILLALGGTCFFGARLLGQLRMLDGSTLETALACGLSKGQMIQVVLKPLGKRVWMGSICETSLYLLALGSFAGCITGNGLTGLAVAATEDAAVFLCIALLLLLILIPVLVPYWFARIKDQ